MAQHFNSLPKVLPMVSPSFGWSVAESYRFENQKVLGRKVRVIVPNSWASSHSCRPGLEPRLLNDFAGVVNEKLLVKFVERYGLLGYGRMHRDQMSDRKEKGDPVSWVLAHARVVRGLLRILEIMDDVRSKRVPLNGSTPLARTFESVFKEMDIAGPTQDVQPNSVYFNLVSPEGERKVWVSDWKSDPIAGVYVLLTELINPQIRGVHYEFLSSSRFERTESKLGVRLRWSALIEVIYWLLAERVGGEFRQCSLCARVFPVSDPREKFCSGSCMNKVRCRNYRARKKSKKQKRRSA